MSPSANDLATHRTSELILATTLCTAGHALQTIEVEGRTAYFTIVENPKVRPLDEVLKAHFSGAFLAEPGRIIREYRRLAFTMRTNLDAARKAETGASYANE
jgi:hypothetical protein